ncbi:MAG: ABC transporter ATP-binding protein [Ignavibacteriales bacterium]|jgi:ABC-type transport system involved in resistance to organic solvents, ATPase component|nr:MAG: ABC transporter ATP-binding protein [Ignavibacteriaceae bacterium]MBW7873921.1 ABC transporter ATP-binding protein [Ignavibacteria bacterium]MCZ2143320.1 ABC transporter ATP-binding protein [Ignavibacteriales bacterium]OQY75107.1 MAG: ABC transporter ATP-binding protein [Ignavibacteriales bacterium UTCHB3]MBV6444202.1 putative ribonucleotide transport ATP-binding protein mkl [Ignavibacteriaceae bacterium]
MIVIDNIYKSFNHNQVLRGLSLTINKGEALAVIGRSGCGKSVLLKHIIGLLKPDSGTVTVEGSDIGKIKQKELYQLRKKFGFLFQGAALFDSMTVGENVALPLIEGDEKISQTEIDRTVAEKLELVGLPGIENLKPAELSGGMKKRVGLARALVTQPEYILYDEPTTGLDPIMSQSIDNLIKDLSIKLNVTAIVVTHDMISVNIVAERVAMLHEGKTYFTGSPEELLNSEDEVIQDFIARTK